MSNDLRETLPSDLVTHVSAICGGRGDEWFSELPSTIARLERKWSISVGQPFAGIEFNFVAEAVSDGGSPVVVKIAPPFETVEIFGEAKFLRLRGGEGAVRLIAEDREAKAILIERALPGRSLVDLFASDPLASVPPAIDVLKTITNSPPIDMRDVQTLDIWVEKFRNRHRGTGFPELEAAKALKLYEQLTAASSQKRYIHGDFHLGNVVDSDRGPFLAIDPKGIVGHTGYDAAVFLINLYRWQKESGSVDALMENAVEIFAEGLGLTPIAVRQWGFVHTVMGAWWSYEDMPGLYDAAVAMPDIWDV